MLEGSSPSYFTMYRMRSGHPGTHLQACHDRLWQEIEVSAICMGDSQRMGQSAAPNAGHVEVGDLHNLGQRVHTRCRNRAQLLLRHLGQRAHKVHNCITVQQPAASTAQHTVSQSDKSQPRLWLELCRNLRGGLAALSMHVTMAFSWVKTALSGNVSRRQGHVPILQQTAFTDR